jgi:hypothetical protein
MAAGERGGEKLFDGANDLWYNGTASVGILVNLPRAGKDCDGSGCFASVNLAVARGPKLWQKQGAKDKL